MKVSDNLLKMIFNEHFDFKKINVTEEEHLFPLNLIGLSEKKSTRARVCVCVKNMLLRLKMC